MEKVLVRGFSLLDHVQKEQPDGEAYDLIESAGVELAW